MLDMLKDKKIVVMGVINKKSIAWGCAKTIEDCGGQVIYTYQNDRVKEQLLKFIPDNGNMIQCDASSDDEIKNAFEVIGKKFGNIDGLIHSIAFANKEDLEGDFVNVQREGFLLAQNISAYSLVAVTRYASAIMNDGASILTMSYIGSKRAIPNYNVMGVAKASLEACVRYLAFGFQNKIRVNAISAGTVKTLAASGVKDFNRLSEISAERTLGKESVSIEEIGNVASFLMSSFSSGINGEVIYVDKGFHLS